MRRHAIAFRYQGRQVLWAYELLEHGAAHCVQLFLEATKQLLSGRACEMQGVAVGVYQHARIDEWHGLSSVSAR